MIHSRRSCKWMDPREWSVIDQQVLMTLFEAARWSPSGFNFQNWRFVYVIRDDEPTDKWNSYLDCLWPPNRDWVKNASALVVIVSKRSGKLAPGISIPVGSQSFDAGSAWMAMALEGTARGLVMHSINGFDRAKLVKQIELNNYNKEEYLVEAFIAIGNRRHQSPPLSPKGEKEEFTENITQRYPIDHIVSHGVFLNTNKKSLN